MNTNVVRSDQTENNSTTRNLLVVELVRFLSTGKSVAFFDTQAEAIQKQLSAKKVDEALIKKGFRIISFDAAKNPSARRFAAAVAQLNQTADVSFRDVCDVISRSSKTALLVYGVGKSSLSQQHFLARLSKFIQNSNSEWKLIFLDDINRVNGLFLEKLGSEYIYAPKKVRQTSSEDPQTKASKKPFGFLAMLAGGSLLLLVIVWLLQPSDTQPVVIDNSVISKSLFPSELSDNSDIDTVNKSSSNTNSAIDPDDIKGWEQHVAEFDRVMQGFKDNQPSSADDKKVAESNADPVQRSERKQLSDAIIGLLQYGQLEALQQEIDSQNINALSSNLETPLIIATIYEHKEVVNWLLSVGANAGLTDKDKRSALHYAAVKGNIDIAQHLIDANANVNQISRLGKTPLMAAVHNNHYAMTELFTRSNASINQQDHSGWSALFYAVWNRNLELVTLLVEQDADINLSDKDGLSVRDVAQAKKADEIIDFFNTQG